LTLEPPYFSANPIRSIKRANSSFITFFVRRIPSAALFDPNLQSQPYPSFNDNRIIGPAGRSAATP
jgi:hypothetical protein